MRPPAQGAARPPRLGAALLLAALAALAAPAAPAHDKRAEMSPAPFMLASRYGRSGARLMAPRNDKFFMNTRYGKRSEPPLSPPRPPRAPRGPPARRLLCEYTGVFPLYRCAAPTPRPPAPRPPRRSDDNPGAGNV